MRGAVNRGVCVSEALRACRWRTRHARSVRVGLCAIAVVGRPQSIAFVPLIKGQPTNPTVINDEHVAGIGDGDRLNGVMH